MPGTPRAWLAMLDERIRTDAANLEEGADENCQPARPSPLVGTASSSLRKKNTIPAHLLSRRIRNPPVDISTFSTSSRPRGPKSRDGAGAGRSFGETLSAAPDSLMLDVINDKRQASLGDQDLRGQKDEGILGHRQK